MHMSNPPRVFVILLNWNRWRDTVECLQSLKALEYSNVSVVVVDNGSTDSSVEHIRVAAPDVVLLETGKNLGFAGGNNVGIRYALREGADFLWLLNNDTTVNPSTLSDMIHSAQTQFRVGAVGSVLYYMDEPERVQAWGGGQVNGWMGTSRHHVQPVPDECLQYLTGASILLRRESLEEIGLLDDRFFMYWEDTDLGFRLRKSGWNLTVAPEAKVWHKESASLGKRSALLDTYFNRSAVVFFRRHSLFPPAPIIAGVGGRLLKRALRRDWALVRGVWTGFVLGIRDSTFDETKRPPKFSEKERRGDGADATPQ